MAPCIECDSAEYEEVECPSCHEMKKACCEAAGWSTECFSCEEKP